MSNHPKKRSQGATGQAPTTRGQILVTEGRFSGPLPPPEVLKGYEEASVGAAERIISMAEKEQAHRHAQTDKELKSIVALTALGQVFAFVIGLAGILAGVFLIWSGKGIEGFGVFLTCLATLVGVYVYAKRREAEPNKQ